MRILFSFLIVCFACIACHDAVDLTSIDKEFDNRNATVSPQGIIISPYDPYRWTRLRDIDETGSVKNIFKVNGNAYCTKRFTATDHRTFKFNKSTKQWQLYEIDLRQFNQNFAYLFSYAHYIYGIELGGRRLGMININTGQFRWMAPFPGIISETWNGAAVAVGGNGFLLGGFEHIHGPPSDRHPAIDQYWKYDIIRDRWTDMGSLPGGGRKNASAFVVGTKIYYGLGYQGDSDKSYDWLALDPSNNTYRWHSSFPGETRSYAPGFTINGKVYLGWAGFTDFWEFNPQEGDWSEKPNPGSGLRHNSYAFSLDNTGYVFSGQTNEFWRYGNPMEVVPVP